MARNDIRSAIQKSLSAIGAGDVPFAIDYPPPVTGADYATNAPLAAAKTLGKNPREVAETLAAELEKAAIPQVEKIEVAGAGFINFYLNAGYFAGVIFQARDGKWGRNSNRNGQKIMVEYTDPNPFKQFHIGHLMSNAVGEADARLLEMSSAAVERANYQGDVGVHVAKALWAVMLKSFDPKDIVQLGEAYTIGAAAYEDDPAAKAEIDELNRKIYEYDPLVYPMYLEGREASLRHFEELYAVLGTKFVHYFFESETGPRGLTIVRAHPDIFEESEGAVIFPGEKYELHTRVFANRWGLPTYEAKELGLMEAKAEKGDFDLSLTITANELKDFSKVVYKAAELVKLGLAPKTRMVFHGFLRLTTGKMSSRKGNIITGESLLHDMIEAAHEKMVPREMDDVTKERVARAVAVAAIKYSILRQTSGKDIIFDPEQSLSLEGDSGPYLQYAHTRCVSILRKASALGIEPRVEQQGVTFAQGSQGDTFLLSNSALPRLVSRFPEVIERAASEFEPHYVTQYLTELAGEFNSFYAREKVLDGTDAAPAKLALVDAVRQTLKNGLWVLGIEAPEEM
jgi:arginyl-tRNA synthetase